MKAPETPTRQITCVLRNALAARRLALAVPNLPYLYDNASKKSITQAESGTPFNPDRAFAYAESFAVASTLMNTIKIRSAIMPWTRKIAGGKIRQATMNIFRAAVTGGLASSAQGAITDAAANVTGVEERKVFDPEKRGKEFFIGATTSGALSTFAGGLKAMPILIEKIKITGNEIKPLGQKISWKDIYIWAAAKSGFYGEHINLDKNWAIQLQPAGISETLKIKAPQAKFRSVAALPDLLKNAKWIEWKPELKGKHGVSGFHYFESALIIDKEVYKVRIVVRELNNPNRKDFYYHRLEIKRDSSSNSGRSGD